MIPLVCAGIIIIEIPIISALCSTITKITVDVAVMLEKNHSVTATTTRPGMTSHFGPYLSNRRPMIGDIRPLMIPPGKSKRPALKAE
ncbi:hypothetical protein D3C81_1604550 [compost metagenome]